jgi:hypothetical protein
VDEAAADAVRRVRRRSPRWWRGDSAREGRTRADVVAELVAALAVYEHALEVGDGPPPETYRTPPRPAREDALADRLAVVTYDLVRALRAATPGAPARHPAGLRTVEALAAVALADVLLHTYDVDPRPLPDAAAGAVLAHLHPGITSDGGAFGDLLLAVERGPRGGEPVEGR